MHYVIFLIASLIAPIVESYWESWDSEIPIETIVEMKSDVINIAFGTFEPDGEGYRVTGVEASEEDLSKLVDLAHQEEKKVKLSVGGATYGLSGILKTGEDAKEMALALHDYVKSHNLDGVDFDIEDYPKAELQTHLIAHTRVLLGEDALITYTPKAPSSTTLPYREVIEQSYADLDGINIMAYDAYSGYSYKDDAKGLYDLGVPRDKIVIGLMPGLDDIGEMTSLKQVKEAAEYVVKEGLGGIMIWDLNRDHKNTTSLGVDASTEAVWAIFTR
ncbi:MAG: hypothetical protein S4CHLAM45_00690 [Chlamydiales bacterium]|nr:hypothetical protein [Chlamydiales bacterium]MCH9619391.1 hypothetical protein [Chlamydiales bacterium]MCH9622195.1 hypothetical protein [Chlamydiales bacterium]